MFSDKKPDEEPPKGFEKFFKKGSTSESKKSDEIKKEGAAAKGEDKKHEDKA